MAAVAAACKSPVVVGTVVAGEVGPVPSGIQYVPAIAAGIAVDEVVGSVVVAFVGAIVAWELYYIPLYLTLLPFTLPHSTVAGIHLGDAVAVACKSHVVVGTVAVG